MTANTVYYIAISSVNSGREGDKSAVIPVKTKDNGLGNITITPLLTDGTVSGFPAAPFTISKTQTPSTHTIEIAEGYTDHKWYVDGSGLRYGRSLTLNALNYSLGKHTVTAEVYKNGVPYSKELIFTVVQ